MLSALQHPVMGRGGKFWRLADGMPLGGDVVEVQAPGVADVRQVDARCVAESCTASQCFVILGDGSSSFCSRFIIFLSWLFDLWLCDLDYETTAVSWVGCLAQTLIQLVSWRCRVAWNHWEQLNLKWPNKWLRLANKWQITMINNGNYSLD